MDTLKIKKAWEVALGPIKGLPMTGIMMYMSGNSLQIFSIMMVFMAFKNPLMGILATNQAFERFETDGNRARLLQVKLAYVAMQVVALALGVWKVNSMGLLPYVSALHVGRWGVIELTLTGTARRGRIGLLGRHRGSRWRGRCRRCRFYTFEWEWQEFFWMREGLLYLWCWCCLHFAFHNRPVTTSVCRNICHHFSRSESHVGLWVQYDEGSGPRMKALGQG